jgi:hypothetical protein
MFRALTFLAVLAASLPFPILAATSDCLESPKCSLADEYIRELSEIQDIMDQTQTEARTAKSNVDTLSNSIHMSRSMINALTADISLLKGVTDTDPKTMNLLISMHSGQISMHQRLMDISTEFMRGPKAGVDYGALAAELPKIRADLDSAGKLYMQMSNLIFAELIDPKPDANNHMSRLIVKQAERLALIDHINRAFGKQIEAKNQSWVCSGAWILRENLQKGFTSSDKG